MKDLIVLVADKEIKALMEGLLPKIPVKSELKPFDFEIESHLMRDNGCANEGHIYLRDRLSKFRFAMVIFDKHGSGQDSITTKSLQEKVEDLLTKNGWENRNACIVIDPELENWVWINNVNLEKAMLWNGDIPLYDWAIQNNWISSEDSKPSDPKGALEAVLRHSKVKRTSKMYAQIGSTVSYKSCTDPAFQYLITTLKKWFPL